MGPLDHSGTPAKVAQIVIVIVDTGAQTNVWSLEAFLQCGFNRKILTPTADLVAANHTAIFIAGAFHAIMKGTTCDRSTIQCRAMVYVSAGIHALYLSPHTLHDLGVVSSNFSTVGEHHIPEGKMQSVVPAINIIRSLTNGCISPDISNEPCSCPLRFAVPPPPTELPFPCIPKNSDRIRD